MAVAVAAVAYNASLDQRCQGAAGESAVVEVEEEVGGGGGADLIRGAVLEEEGEAEGVAVEAPQKLPRPPVRAESCASAVEAVL